jgi:hypothetical protein
VRVSTEEPSTEVALGVIMRVDSRKDQSLKALLPAMDAGGVRMMLPSLEPLADGV